MDKLFFIVHLGNGTKYIGEWKDGLASGYGRMEWYFGDTYTGEFKEGKPHGRGTMDWATQTEKKVGQKVDGYGTFHWPSGSNYVVGGKMEKLLVMEFTLGLKVKNI